jgi:hypothetical protein
MCLRWTATGMLEAERQFRRVIGYPKLSELAVVIERDVARDTLIDTPAPEVAATTVGHNSPRNRRRSSTANGTSSARERAARGARQGVQAEATTDGSTSSAARAEEARRLRGARCHGQQPGPFTSTSGGMGS